LTCLRTMKGSDDVKRRAAIVISVIHEFVGQPSRGGRRTVPRGGVWGGDTLMLVLESNIGSERRYPKKKKKKKKVHESKRDN